MEQKIPLIEVLLKNKDKILKAEKYNKNEFENFLNALMQAETQRKSILKKIKEMGELNSKKLKEELEISEELLKLNIKYLQELGLLEFIGEFSEFYRGIEKKNDKEGLFPDISVIINKLICNGCGLCVSVCPMNAISYSNEILAINEELCISCGLCYVCCPRSFFPAELKKNQELIDINNTYRKELNYFKNIYTAQTKDEFLQEKAQDGGIVTTLLKTAFNQGLIDAALVVGESEKPLEPIPILIENEADLLNTAGTKYSNAHVLKILYKSIKYKKIAVVGTPCILNALKKISFYPLNKPLYDNIALRIGLFCMESFDYENIINILNQEFQKDPEEIKKMDINKGHFFIHDINGETFDVQIKQIKKYARFGCFLCDDLTSELSDISVGSIGSEPGWSTVIVRTNKGADLFQDGINRQLIQIKKIEEKSGNFTSLSRIAKSKLKMYKEIPRQKTLEQDPSIRGKNFEEVPFGFDIEMVKLETQRCLQCGNPLCVTGCPVNVNIPVFIRFLKQEKYQEASRFIKNFNLLPAICGRVCPQEIQCEEKCLLGNVDKPIAIGSLERFIADWERKNNLKEHPDCEPPNNIKVAIVGSGPSGLTCAGELIKKGYDITVFEALHTGGGVLAYGIPEFRLPKAIVKDEIETLKMLGVKFEYNRIIGKTLDVDDLKAMGYKAIFLGVGAGLPIFINIPGLSLNGVLSANEFLTRANLMKAYQFPKYDTPIKIGNKVVVIGGGNVAMDSARVALRLGAKKVIVVYRRSEKEMPARREEYHHGVEEGIEFQFLTNPVRFIGDNNGSVKQMEVIKMKLGELDQSGRRRPIPIENSEYLIYVDTIIVAIGTKANPICPKSIPGLELNKWGYIVISEGGKANLEGIYAGGDIVTGSATVISAMGAGKRASKAIHEYLTHN